MSRNLKSVNLERFMKEVKDRIKITDTDFGENMRQYNTVLGDLATVNIPAGSPPPPGGGHK